MPRNETYMITDRTGNQTALKRMDDEGLGKLAFAASMKVRKAIYHLLEVRRELMKRGKQHPKHIIKPELNIFDSAFALAMNDFNGKYKAQIEKYGVPFNTDKYPHCDHKDYADTLTGAKCNDCGEEVGGEEE